MYHIDRRSTEPPTGHLEGLADDSMINALTSSLSPPRDNRTRSRIRRVTRFSVFPFLDSGCLAGNTPTTERTFKMSAALPGVTAVVGSIQMCPVGRKDFPASHLMHVRSLPYNNNGLWLRSFFCIVPTAPGSLDPYLNQPRHATTGCAADQGWLH